jgi:LysM repeat protein
MYRQAQSDKKAKGKQLLAWVPLVAAALSLLSALGAAAISYYGNRAGVELQREVERLDANMRQAEIELAEQSFDAGIRARRDELLAEYVPKLLGPDDHARDQAAAALTVIYPDEAQYILETLADATSDKAQAAALRELAKRAYDLAKRAGDFVVAFGSDETLADAQDKIKEARELGYSPKVYRKGGQFVTTVGPFKNGMEAERHNAVIRREILPTSYTVNLTTWCNADKLVETATIGYHQCASPASIVHTMHNGENLESIAHKYGVTLESLKRANNLSDLRAALAGQRLQIPQPQRELR